MTTPVLALRAAIRSACLADPTLTGLMGGPVRLYDEPPRGSPALYAVFGDTEVRDLSTSTERGHEQEAGIVVWALPGSTASAIRVGDRLSEILDDARLVLAGHRLIHIALTAFDVARDDKSRLATVTLRFRAVTEVAT